MNTFKEQILQQLNEFYDGDPWVTENFRTKVATLEAGMALKRIPAFNHNIAEIVEHMVAWRNFVSGKLQGDAEFDIIDNTKSDWPEVRSWEITLDNFDRSHTALIISLEDFAIDKWQDIVPRRSYDFAYMVNGLVQHDYYHYGQIGCLIAAQLPKNDL